MYENFVLSISRQSTIDFFINYRTNHMSERRLIIFLPMGHLSYEPYSCQSYLYVGIILPQAVERFSCKIDLIRPLVRGNIVMTSDFPIEFY